MYIKNVSVPIFDASTILYYTETESTSDKKLMTINLYQHRLYRRRIKSKTAGIDIENKRHRNITSVYVLNE